MAYNGDGNFWYTLNNDTKIAQISYTGPVGGGEARFITYEDENNTRLCFFCTFRASGGYILKPITFTYDENLEAWIVFYPVYTNFLDWWTPKRKPDAVCLSLVKNAWNILECLIEAHKEGVAHGDLQENSNYVIVGEAQAMLINFKIRRNMETDQEWRAICLQDIETFLEKLLEHLPTYRLQDHDMIMSYLNTMKTSGDGTSDELLLYPYWKSAYKRMMVYFEASIILENSATRLYEFDAKVRNRNIITFPWDTGLTGRIVNGGQVEVGLKTVYNDGCYYGGSVQSLVKFLRNVYVHATNGGIYEEFDRYLSKKYPGFVSFVHYCLKC